MQFLIQRKPKVHMRMRAFSTLFLTASLTLLPYAAARAEKAVIPMNHERVMDTTGTLTLEQKDQIVAMSKAIDDRTGAVILTLLVLSLNGEESIEEFGIRVAETLTPGHSAESKSAVLLIAKNDRKVRIEVNRFLGQTLTDAKARQLVDAMKAQLKSGDYNGAITTFYSRIQEYLPLRPASAEDVPATVRRDEGVRPMTAGADETPAYDYKRLGFGFAALLTVAAIFGPFWPSRRKKRNQKPKASLPSNQPAQFAYVASANSARKGAKWVPDARKQRTRQKTKVDTPSSFVTWSFSTSDSSSSGSDSCDDESSDNESCFDSSGDESSFDGGGSSSDD